MTGPVAMVSPRPTLTLPCSKWEASRTTASIALLSSDNLPLVSSLGSRKEQLASVGSYGMTFCGVIGQKSQSRCRRGSRHFRVEASANGGPQGYDYDVIVIGAGVGGHGAALHAVEKVSMPNLNHSAIVS